MTKVDLRAQAVILRKQGLSVPAIAVELKVARSTAFRWTKDIPREGNEEAVRRRKAHSKAMTDARWADHRVELIAERAAIHASSVAEVGALTDRERVLVGAALYWAEGSKAKPWRPNHWPVTFTNSDAGMIELFLGFLECHGYSRHDLVFRLSIHESADVSAVEHWWGEQLGLNADKFAPATLKRHNPTSVRHNSGDDYHGCLVVNVRKPMRLYWRIEGLMKGVMASTCHGAEGEALS